MTTKNTVMTLRTLIFCACSISLISCSSKSTKESTVEEEPSLQFEKAAKEQLLEKWYPLVIDSADGGYFSEVTHDFQLGEKHDKMIVTQARHIWTNAKAAKLFPEEKPYLEYAKHGFNFLRNVMWDKEHGGFFNLVNKEGDPILKKGDA